MPAPGVTDPHARSAFRLAFPSIVENFFHSAVYMVDAMFLATLGESELAASSFAGMLMWRLNATVASHQYAFGAYIARRWGEGRHALAREAASHAVTLAAVLGMVVVIAMMPLLELVLGLLSGSAEVVPTAYVYIVPILLAFPLQQARVVLSSSLRAAGDTVSPQIATLIVNLVNVFLNWVLIFGNLGAPRLGIMGAGIGTALAIATGALFLFFRARFGIRPRKLFADAPRRAGASQRDSAVVALPTRGARLWLPSVTPRIARLAGPSLIEEILITIGFLGFFRMITDCGTTAMAAHSAVSAIESLSFNAGAGFAFAAGTLVGQCLGRRDKALALRSMQLCVLFAVVVMGGLGICFAAFPGVFVRAFLPPDAGPDFAYTATILLLIVAVEQPVLGATQVLGGSLRGAGDTLSPTIAQIAGTVCVRLGLGYYLAFGLGWGVVGLYWATVVDWTLRTSVLSYLVFRGRWSRIHA
ncbi:MAG: MATE family efflux transporter [Candidatus Sumerlaeia bacterium]|nr:MATE family efflux transporter [Candidatus Sumerlaeia bacterium]